jgi:putative endopeptidase
MKIQTRLANASKQQVELRDPEKRYNKISLADFTKATPNFSWADYMKARNIAAISEINFGQPEFFAHFQKS